MSETVSIRIDEQVVTVLSNTTVAVALMISGVTSFRTSVSGEPRSPLCGMGTCFECRVTIDGRPQRRSCRIECREGMEIQTT